MRANLSVLENLRNVSHRTMVGQMMPFNVREKSTCGNQKQLYAQLETNPKNEEIRKKLTDLMDKEELYWMNSQQNPNGITPELSKDLMDFLDFLNQMKPETVDGKTAFDAAFTPHPGFGQPKRPKNP
jgi:hypothetical protein